MIFGLTAWILPGCQEQEEIRRYQVPKSEQPKVRLLAAIYPQSENTWFFKLLGPENAVAENENAFHTFIHSVRFPGNGKEEIEWTIPNGWREEKPVPPRYASFRIGVGLQELDFSVTKLPGKAGTVLLNVNRWRGQIGLEPVTEMELSNITRQWKIDGVGITVVDIVGPGKTMPMR
jgi:hypothetical protein